MLGQSKHSVNSLIKAKRQRVLKRYYFGMDVSCHYEVSKLLMYNHVNRRNSDFSCFVFISQVSQTLNTSVCIGQLAGEARISSPNLDRARSFLD